jgi:hypothetical protein
MPIFRDYEFAQACLRPSTECMVNELRIKFSRWDFWSNQLTNISSRVGRCVQNTLWLRACRIKRGERLQDHQNFQVGMPESFEKSQCSLGSIKEIDSGLGFCSLKLDIANQASKSHNRRGVLEAVWLGIRNDFACTSLS